jgi:hypothetical protein
MAIKNKRRFTRERGIQRYRKLFIISTEGAKTEPQYFQLFKNQQALISVKCLKCDDKSSPQFILKRMERYLKLKGLKATDEAWLVVDNDQWSEIQLRELYLWSQLKANHGLAVSNPKFEYWLLLHYEDGVQITSVDCSKRLMRYLPDYNKYIDFREITQDKIVKAIRRAKELDFPPCVDWPRSPTSTVYRLVEKLIEGMY